MMKNPRPIRSRSTAIRGTTIAATNAPVEIPDFLELEVEVGEDVAGVLPEVGTVELKLLESDVLVVVLELDEEDEVRDALEVEAGAS
jgi:hypothetical protein